MINLQRITQQVIAEEVSGFILRQMDRKHRICLAFRYGRPSRQCKETFRPSRKRRDHQCCTKACYQRLHRVPGFIRKIVRGA